LIKRVLANNTIRAKEVRLIDETGEQSGIVPIEKALREAGERGLDLVQVTEKVEPPVCKIMDKGKYLYQLKKKESKQSHQKGGGTKGVRIRFNTSEHDLGIRAKQAHKFLEQGNKIKIELILRGREKALQQHAYQQISKFLEILKNYVAIEIDKPNKRLGNRIVLIVKKQQYAKSEDKQSNS